MKISATIVCMAILAGCCLAGSAAQAAEKAAEPAYMKDHPLMKQGQDLRPHMPKILEIMGPLVGMIVSELKAYPDPMHTARFVPHLEDIAAEMREMYLLSMSIAKTEVEAEQLYQRVLATERAVKELRTKR
jgi:hypothetical protein